MEKIIRFRLPIIIGIILLTIFFGYSIKNITKDTGITALLPTDDENYIYYREMEKIFGASEEFIVVLYDDETIYKKENIEAIHELSTFLKSIKEIDPDDILSLTTVDDINCTNDELTVNPLIKEELIRSLTDGDLKTLQSRIEGNQLFKNRLVNHNAKATIIVAPSVPDEENITLITNKINDKIADMRKTYKNLHFYLSGNPVNESYISKIMDRDLTTLMPISLCIVILLLFLFMKSFTGVLLPIIVVIFSILTTFGIKALLHSPMTISESSIPIMLIAIGSADGVHIVSEFLTFVRHGKSVISSIRLTMKNLWLSVLMTSITTSIGTISLLSSPGQSLKNLGFYLSIGVLTAMLLSLILLPLLLTFYKAGKNTHLNENHHTRISKYTEKTANLIIQYKMVPGLFILFILGISIFGVINVNVDGDEFKFLKKNHPFRYESEKIKDIIGGIINLDVIIEGGVDDAIKEPSVLKFMKDLQNFAEKQEEVSFSISFADYIQRMNFVINNSDPAFNRLPYEIETLADGEKIPGKNLTAQLLMLYEMGGGNPLSEFIDFNYKKSRIVIRLKETGHNELKSCIDKLSAFIKTTKPDNIKVKFSGHYLNLNVVNFIVKSQIQSIVITVITIFIFLSIIYRSFVIGAITVIPVFIAILFNFAVMWIANISLNIGTAIVASIGMGIGIDYAIHFFNRFKMIYNTNIGYDEALKQSIVLTAPSILINAASVGLGFSVLVLSSCLPINALGWIITLTMFTTASGSLIGLPAILSIVKPDPNGWFYKRRGQL